MRPTAPGRTTPRRLPPKRALWDTSITEILAGYYEPVELGGAGR